ncbi:signal recognition particle-docking protein FtsY [Lujinxingia vulgaris]|uniref:Signal recognition particle receptor FtsY n=1 Tax=Lujinxingia vulgaris TaxID=2600176 RepID=A0A5C6XDG5_9DELT|nr:signal recognition particle-docking protein FtsY [Lujinxingia vulgaris]TXD37821.1 signal recognition particle-docking protein FtsY [Lujinxingia vulgaris]
MSETLLSSATTLTLIGQAAEVEPVSWLPIVLVAVVLIAVVALLLFLRKGGEKPGDRPRAEPRDRSQAPTADLLEDRDEVDAPVEIHEGMTLAEIKRAKRARVKGEGARRETAAEATERSARDHAEAKASAEEPSEEVSEAPAEEPAEEVSEAPAEEPSEEVNEAPAEEALKKASTGLPRPKAKLPEIEAPEEGAGLGEESSISLPKPRPQAERAKSGAGTLPKPKLPKPAAKPAPKPEAEAEETASDVATEVEAPAVQPTELDKPSAPEPASLRDGLQKTRTGFVDRLGKLFSAETIPDDLIDEVEEILFTADIGAKIAQRIIDTVEDELSGDEKRDPSAIWGKIRAYCEDILSKHEGAIDFDAHKPFVMLVIGVNGVGKTTTIGKIASKLKREGKSVMLVAGDTFRAAAVEQLDVWAKRTNIPIHRGEDNADPASVIYAGIEKGIAEGADVIICDTAGRLHTKVNLLDELGKIGRVTGKALEGAPHETILVLDANTGQNAIQQASMFKEACDITGVVLTKLDGTAKGGVILGICDELDAPVRYIGIGEGVEDLRAFNSGEFVEALFM